MPTPPMGRRYDEWLTTELVGKRTCYHSTYKTSHKGCGCGYTLHYRCVIDMEKLLIERFCSAYDNPVIAEE